MKSHLIRLLTTWLFKLTSAEYLMMLAKERLVLDGNRVEIKIKKVMALRKIGRVA